MIDAVVMANPILKAVHGGTEAAPLERFDPLFPPPHNHTWLTFTSELLPYVERRDEASIAVAEEVAKTGRVCEELTSMQSKTLLASRENVTSTAELFELAEEAKQKKRIPPNNNKMMEEQAKLEAELKTSKQRWRVMKGVASGIIAGSGIDWARDDELRDVVLDPEMEE